MTARTPSTPPPAAAPARTGSPAATATAATASAGMPTPARFSFRPVAPRTDAPLIHSWVTHPKAAFWLMTDASPAEVERVYAGIAGAPHQDAFLGEYDGLPACLMERYDPARVELDGLYPAEPGDVGMHFLVAPTDRPVHGFTRAVIAAVLRELFADPATRRIVVEPDVRNTAVHALNETVGFQVARRIRTPHKEAYLSFCTRVRFEEATR